MVYNYFSSVGFSFCALCFLVLIVIMYTSKEKYKNIENTLFIALLALNGFLILDEFVYVYCISIKDSIPLLTTIMCKSYLIGIVCWMATFLYYMVAQITRKIEVQEEKESIRKKMLYLHIGLVILLSVLVLIFPIEYKDYTNHFYNFGGPAINIGYIMGAIVIVVALYWLFTTNKDMTKESKKPLLLAIFFNICIVAVQFFVPNADYNIQNFEFATILMALFFTLESQDNKLLSEREKSKEEAEKVNAIQTQFLTSMSHEIRTPMSTIMGFSESLLREGDVTEEMVKHDTKYIHLAAVNLLDLINNILDLSRIDSKKEQMVEQEFELKESLLEVSEAVNTKIENKDVKFEIKINEELPSKYVGDAPKVSKIVSNLIGYLINKSEIRDLVLNVSDFKLSNGEFAFLISLIVTSPLVEEEYQKLEKEYEELKENEVNNLTLGLVVAKRYIELIGANLNISHDANFIRYDIYVPVQVIDPTPIGNIFEEIQNIENAKLDLTGKKILVVDDNEINIKLIKRLLAEYNPDIDSCTNGMEAINKVQEVRYDLIFLDHMMPGLDGIQTLSKMKDLIASVPPAIALTANSYSGAREKYIEDGFYDYLAKPFNVNDLKNLLIGVFYNKK